MPGESMEIWGNISMGYKCAAHSTVGLHNNRVLYGNWTQNGSEEQTLQITALNILNVIFFQSKTFQPKTALNKQSSCSRRLRAHDTTPFLSDAVCSCRRAI